jgi:hypothetical protein
VRTEVVGLHEFFVGWFTGTIDDTDAALARLRDALHPAFSMIVPSGVVLEHGELVASVRAAHGTADPSFTIEIHGLVERPIGQDAVLVTYEEWQLEADRVLNRRTSTACFVRSSTAPCGVAWRHLHETLQA